MIEDAITNAFKNLNNTLLGSLLIILMIAYYFTVRFLRQDLKEVQEELRREREAHQKTRDEQLTDLRNLAHVAKAVDEMRTALVDYSLGRRS